MHGKKRLCGPAVMVILSMVLVPMASGQEAPGRGERRMRQGGGQRQQRGRGGPGGQRNLNAEDREQLRETNRQDGAGRGERRMRQDGGQRQRIDRGGFGGPGGFGGRGGPRAFTEEDRERFEEMLVDRYMERLTRDYELDDRQQAQVRSELDQVREQHREFVESRSDEFEDLRTRMRELRSEAGEGEPFDREQARELGERMRTLWQDAPLMNRQQIREKVENMLPAEQAESGRARWESVEQERERRRQEMRERFAERRQQREARRARDADAADPDGSQSEQDETAGADDGEQRRGRRQGLDEWRRQRRQRQDQNQDRDQNREQPQGAETPNQNPQVQSAIPENPIGPWEQYVRDFTQRYRLDTSQLVTAQSVLREMQQRRTAYEQTRRGDFESAQQIEDVGRRQQRLDELNRPVTRLFEELKSRLERIPTARQRRLASARPPATQPAANEPTETTTRPADADEQNRRTREERRNRRGNRE